jgi:mRNA interferase RelE/StbE
MKYRAIIEKPAQKQLDKLDAYDRTRIVKWIIKNLDGCENPRLYGKALAGDLRGSWRYRVGSYRLIAHIDDDIVEIRLVKIGNRKNVYE